MSRSVSENSIRDINVNVKVNTDIESESEVESEIISKAKAEGGSSSEDDGEKVVMCHNGQTIEVAPSAVQAHLDHGDTLGPCEDEEESEEVEE